MVEWYYDSINKKAIMKEIKGVTLIAVDCINYSLTIKSLKECISKCKFDRVIFITDILLDLKGEGIEVIKIDRINNKKEYSEFMCTQLYKHFHTIHCLIVQHDSVVLDENCWDENFKNYDCIGARWGYVDGRDVGNGGFALRSWKLQNILATDTFIDIYSPEDEIIGRLYRHYLEKKYDIKFAPNDVCDKFAYELHAPSNKTFGRHGYFHPPFKEHIILKRTAALGDVVMLEPIIDFYSKKGYQVVLDTIPEFMQLFMMYKHPIKHISQMDKRISPIKEINFDMFYENKPRQSVLKSYIELTGELIIQRNSILNFNVKDNAYLFDKYILIHIDNTNMSYRNCHGVNWDFVVKYYQRLGYLVLQIGKRMDKQICQYIHTDNIESLMFMISGASFVIGIDSSPTQISVALGKPTVIFFGSVNPKLRYTNFDNIAIIHKNCTINKDRFCYHETTGSAIGVECEVNKELPPCTNYNEYDVINSVTKLLTK